MLKEIQNFCEKFDDSCKLCPYFNICGKAPFQWNKDTVEKLDPIITKRIELEECFRRR